MADISGKREFRALLAGAKYPARSPDVNVADIKAQVAANEKGVQELQRVVGQFGWPTGQRLYAPRHGQRRGVGAPGDRSHRSGRFDYQMDNGKRAARGDQCRPRRLAARWSTSPAPAQQDEGNFNSPPAVTRAAVLYVFRCLVGDDIPLNDGCLKPLKLIIPPGTFLSPQPGRGRGRRQYRGFAGHLQRASSVRWARSPARRRR